MREYNCNITFKLKDIYFIMLFIEAISMYFTFRTSYYILLNIQIFHLMYYYLYIKSNDEEFTTRDKKLLNRLYSSLIVIDLGLIASFWRVSSISLCITSINLLVFCLDKHFKVTYLLKNIRSSVFAYIVLQMCLLSSKVLNYFIYNYQLSMLNPFSDRHQGLILYMVIVGTLIKLVIGKIYSKCCLKKEIKSLVDKEKSNINANLGNENANNQDNANANINDKIISETSGNDINDMNRNNNNMTSNHL